MSTIHQTAIIDPAAEIDASCRIGPYCVVGAGVKLGADVVLHSHVVIEGDTAIGAGTEIFSFACLGSIPQDLKFGGEDSSLRIGERNRIREHVTMNPGTKGGGLLTRVGNGCLFMVGAHVAHDCIIGDNIIMANNATLAGHVAIEDGAIIGGLAAIHQFVRIGRYAMIGGMSGVEHDVIPYGVAMGERAALKGLNVIGMKRHGIERESIRALQNAYELLFDSSGGTLVDKVAAVSAAYGDFPEVKDLVAFLEASSPRATLQPTG